MKSQGHYSEAETHYLEAINVDNQTLTENYSNTQTIFKNYIYLLSQFPDEELQQRYPAELVEKVRKLREGEKE